MNEKDKNFFLDSLFKIKFVPPAVADGADFHVCSDAPVLPGVNYEDVCAHCGRLVFYSTLTAIKKRVCANCARSAVEGNPNAEFVTPDTPFLRALKHHFLSQN